MAPRHAKFSQSCVSNAAVAWSDVRREIIADGFLSYVELPKPGPREGKVWLVGVDDQFGSADEMRTFYDLPGVDGVALVELDAIQVQNVCSGNARTGTVLAPSDYALPGKRSFTEQLMMFPFFLRFDLMLKNFHATTRLPCAQGDPFKDTLVHALSLQKRVFVVNDVDIRLAMKTLSSCTEEEMGASAFGKLRRLLPERIRPLPFVIPARESFMFEEKTATREEMEAFFQLCKANDRIASLFRTDDPVASLFASKKLTKRMRDVVVEGADVEEFFKLVKTPQECADCANDAMIMGIGSTPDKYLAALSQDRQMAKRLRATPGKFTVAFALHERIPGIIREWNELDSSPSREESESAPSWVDVRSLDMDPPLDTLPLVSTLAVAGSTWGVGFACRRPILGFFGSLGVIATSCTLSLAPFLDAWVQIGSLAGYHSAVREVWRTRDAVAHE